MNEYDYTGDKTKNYFTAYLQKCIRWRRWNYLKSKEKIHYAEKLCVDMDLKYSMTLEEVLEINHKEKLLLKEREGIFPKWGELQDQRLVNILMMLSEEERNFIYQHVFEERTFKEIGMLNGLTDERVKGIYYYAIRKIRSWMRGGK